MFAGIDVASERHMLARLDAQGVPLGKPVPITEDREGYDALLRLLGPPPVLVAMEATGHYWKNLYAVLVAAEHNVVLLNPLKTRRFQDSALERTKTDAIDAVGIARFAFEKRPETTQLHGKREPTPTVDGTGRPVQATLAARASLQFQGRSSLSLLAR